MAIKYVKVQKGNVTKEIMEKDLPEYIAMGWKKVEVTPIIELYRKAI